MRPLAKIYRLLAALGLSIALPQLVHGQIAALDKGHRILVNNGLQIWGLHTDQAYPLNYGELAAGNMNGVMWSYGAYNPNSLSAGQKWGFWADYHGNPATALDAAGVAHQNDLIAVQVGDEQQSDIENPAGFTKAWFDAAHAGNHFNNSLLYVNSFFINNGTQYANFIASANPDAISWDGYPFANPHGAYILPKNWLTLGNTFRRYALGSYIGATGTSPRPYGMYLQTFNDSLAVDPGEAEIRWQQFTAWTLGYKFADAFIYRGGNNNFGSNPAGPVYQAFQETARQGRNLGPALTKLISYGYGPSFIQGAGSSGLPGEWITFDRNNAEPSQRYLTGLSNVTNLGSKNGGLSGDVYVGFFNPLHLSFGDPTGTTYFMVTNGLGGDLSLPNGQSDNTATVAETRQQMTLNFDFGITGINSLQRLNRNTGLVDVINTGFSDGGNTVFTSLGSGKYQLQLKLDGGTGDLFKYNDGSPFVGVETATPLAYWDPDLNAANNDPASGAGLGGNGSWDSGGPRFYNGIANTTYAQGSNVLFAGAAGTVSFTAAQTVGSMQFKTDGYLVTGASLTLAGPMIYTDAGVTATINAPLNGSKGLIKNGPGTLKLLSAGNYTGGTTINEGVLAISNSSLGVTAGPAPSIQINNGAILRFDAAGINLGAARQIVLGSGGGVIDTAGNDTSINSNISGTTLTKVGNGTLALSGVNSHFGTTVYDGTLRIGNDVNLGATPANFTAGNLTLDGGTLQFSDTLSIGNNRGITLGPGGGTIDTQIFSNPGGYNAFQGGFRGPGDLTKIGTGMFFSAATTGGANVSWSGRLIIKEGTWKIVASDGLPYNVPAAAGLKADQVTLDGGTWQIGATINVTNVLRGVTIAAGGGTIDTNGFNLSWSGPLAGNVATANLNKIGAGTLTLRSSANASTYSGMVNVNVGMLTLEGGTAMGDLAAINLANSAGVGLTFSSGNEVVGALSGGGAAGGNLLNSGASLTTGGNNNSTTFSGLISGSGQLNKTGTGTFTLARSGGNTYTGATGISGGKLLVNNTTGSGTGTGHVIVSAAGTLGGTGIISGNVTVLNGGHIAPGVSIESLDVASLYLSASFNLDFEFDTVTGIDTSDLINVTTTNGLTISGAGTLNITNAGTMTGGVYTLIDYNGVLNGNLSNLALGTKPAGFTYSLVHNAANTSINLIVTMPGDFNGDGVVDAGDYVVWRKGLGTTYTQTDFDTWRAHFGETAPTAASASAVPEPGSCVLLLFALLGLQHSWRYSKP